MHPYAALFWETVAFVMIWVAFAYIVALYKSPGLMMYLFTETTSAYCVRYGFELNKRPRWLRKVASTVVFVLFFWPMASGMYRLLNASIAADWHESTQYLFIGLPTVLAAIGGAFAVVVCGWYVGIEYREKMIKHHDDLKGY